MKIGGYYHIFGGVTWKFCGLERPALSLTALSLRACHGVRYIKSFLFTRPRDKHGVTDTKIMNPALESTPAQDDKISTLYIPFLRPGDTGALT
jgi:hypothetical protein